MKDGAFGNACGTALVFASEIHRRININCEGLEAVSRKLGLERNRVSSVARIARICGGVPSKERLALIAQKTPDVTDEDIAEWFGETVRWSRNVRANAAALRRDEYIPAQYEWVDGEYESDIPSPEEMERAKAELHAKGLACMQPCGLVSRAPGIRHLVWHGGQHAFLSVGT